MKTISKETFVLAMSPEHKQVERTESGSTVVFESYDCFSNKITSEDITFSIVGWDNVNPASGPLFVEGAEVGDTLKVEIIDIEIADQGVMATLPGAGAFASTIKEEASKIIPIKDGKAIFNDKLHIPVNPMIGVIGTAPKEGEVPTGTPGDHGANMDCKKVTKGSTVYLPVNIPGGMLSIGDAHAVMGDGELVVCGLEIPSKTTVKVTVLKGQEYPLPFLVDNDHVMTIASAETLDAASIRAAENMQQFLMEQLGMDPVEAGMFLSVGADLKVCQIVNPLKTARVELPQWVLKEYNVTVK